jgi:type IV pilus assembly protein PilV
MHGITKRGFTLLEVLIALLIFSLGLMGLAGLLTTSVKTNHSAYLRTQAIFLAQGMADRMRANPLALWNSTTNYNLHTVVTTVGTAPTAASVTASPTNCASGCDFGAIATRDLQIFQNQLLQFLPNAGVAIKCTAVASPPAPNWLLTLPPYAQSCEMQISWTQLPITGQNAAQIATPDIFDWVFQP